MKCEVEGVVMKRSKEGGSLRWVPFKRKGKTFEKGKGGGELNEKLSGEEVRNEKRDSERDSNITIRSCRRGRKKGGNKSPAFCGKEGRAGTYRKGGGSVRCKRREAESFTKGEGRKTRKEKSLGAKAKRKGEMEEKKLLKSATPTRRIESRRAKIRESGSKSKQKKKCLKPFHIGEKNESKKSFNRGWGKKKENMWGKT